MHRTRRAVVALTLLATVSHALPATAQGKPSSPAADTAGVSRRLDAIYAGFRDAYARLDVEAVTGLYAEDAIYLAAGEAPRRGRAAIRPVFEKFFEGVRCREGSSLALEFRILRRDLAAGLATDVGYYRLAVVKQGVRGRPSVGRFVTVMRPDSAGQWHFVVDSYSGAEPAEFDAAPPRDP